MRKKKGQIKVIKIDEDNNEIKLEDVVFDVLDSNNNIVDTITTNSNGEAITKNFLLIRIIKLLKNKHKKNMYYLLKPQ